MLVNKRNWIFSILFILSACSARAPGGASNGRIINFTNCQLNPDQGKGSLQGAWGGLPVSLVFDNDFYMTDGGEAMPSLRRAADTWNGWAALRSYTGFSISNDTTGISAGRMMPDISSCEQAAYSSQITDVVGVWKIASSGAHKNQRESCALTSDGLPGRILPSGVQGQTDWITNGGAIIGSSVLINFEEYNAPGKVQLDVESLLLHELGHVIGLLHSCNGSSGSSIDGTSAPSCFSGAASSFYLEAVMFPFLDARQIRRNLTQNEYDRINCLY
jgi:hypothetical protein